MGIDVESEGSDKKYTTEPENAKGHFSVDDIDFNNLFLELESKNTPEAHTEDPVSGLDKQVEAIYRQASRHRDKLLTFFIWYTVGFTVFVIALIKPVENYPKTS